MAKASRISISQIAAVAPQTTFAIIACAVFWMTIGQPDKSLPQIDERSPARQALVNTQQVLVMADQQSPAVLARQGKAALAVAGAHALADEKPFDVVSNLCVGNVLVEHGNKDEGIRYLKTAVALAPQSRWLRLNLAQKLSDCSKTADAKEQYQLICQAYPLWSAPHVALAEIYLQNQDPESAANELKLALQSDSSNFYARKLRAIALARTGQMSRGLGEYVLGEAAEQSKTPIDIKQFLDNYGMPDRALFQLRRLVQDHPEDPMNKLRLARMLIYTGQLPEAKTLLLEIRRAIPGNFEVHRNLAFVLQRLGDSNVAISEFAQSIRLEQNATGSEEIKPDDKQDNTEE